MIISNQSDILVTALNLLGDLSFEFWDQNDLHRGIMEKLNTLYDKIYKLD